MGRTQRNCAVSENFVHPNLHWSHFAKIDTAKLQVVSKLGSIRNLWNNRCSARTREELLSVKNTEDCS